MMNSDEVKEAMRNFTPVKYKGEEYKSISAYIFRRVTNPHTGKYTFILQVELESRCGHSVTIADAKKVELIK